jgi:hypothetical protein
LGSVHSPTPGIEVLSCDREALSFGGTTSLLDWAMNQPKIAWILIAPLFAVVWLPFLSPGHTWPAWFYVAELVSAPVLVALLALGILWSLFFLIRWIARILVRRIERERERHSTKLITAISERRATPFHDS